MKSSDILERVLLHIDLDDVAKTVYHEPYSFSVDDLDVYYGNRELSVYVDGEEEPYHWDLNFYSGRWSLVSNN